MNHEYLIQNILTQIQDSQNVRLLISKNYLLDIWTYCTPRQMLKHNITTGVSYLPLNKMKAKIRGIIMDFR